jgi:hypothetical protein
MNIKELLAQHASIDKQIREYFGDEMKCTSDAIEDYTNVFWTTNEYSVKWSDSDLNDLLEDGDIDHYGGDIQRESRGDDYSMFVVDHCTGDTTAMIFSNKKYIDFEKLPEEVQEEL